MQKKIHIIGGGTFSHVRSHLALAAPAFGSTAKALYKLFKESNTNLGVKLYLTKMAGGRNGVFKLETNSDIDWLIVNLRSKPSTKVIVMTAALVDFNGSINGISGKYADRLNSRQDSPTIQLSPAHKIIKNVRTDRKDIFLVGCKTTAGKSENEQYIAGLHLLKEASCNLVLANDVVTRTNMIITPEEARYHVTTNRDMVLRNLVDMVNLRSHLTFTRSTVVSGESVPWDSPDVPRSLREVVNYCINKNAYKPFRGSTVGHFACRIGENEFLTSIRKSNFNDLPTTGLVKVTTDGPDSVIAYGAKPSVGGQSQRIVFHEHDEYDCIVHFHCPIKPNSVVPTVSQREYECGSHECGKNTSSGLKKFGNLSAVYLDQHGPNIVFHRSIDPHEVIKFIEDNFSLDEKTGGYVELGSILNVEP